MTPRIGIAGVAGRMGRLLAEEVRHVGATFSAGYDTRPDAPDLPDVPLVRDVRALAQASDIVIDFTHATAVRNHAAALTEAGTAWVLGTTGLSAEDEAAVGEASHRIAIVHAPNFSSGVTLVMALAERMAAALPATEYDAEIIEMHHRQKVDAPSGTAIGIGRAVARGRDAVFDDVMDSPRHGNQAARRVGAIGFAALRGGQVVGEHTLIFAAADEQIVLTHRAFDRRSFATGAVRAALWVAGRKPGLYGMEDVLGLR